MNALAAFCISGKLFCEDASDSIALGRQRWSQLYGEAGKITRINTLMEMVMAMVMVMVMVMVVQVDTVTTVQVILEEHNRLRQNLANGKVIVIDHTLVFVNRV